MYQMKKGGKSTPKMKKGGSVGSSKMKKYREGGPGGPVKPKFGNDSKNESIYGKPGLGRTIKTPGKSDVDAMFGNTTIGQDIKIKKAKPTPKIKTPFGENPNVGPKKFKMGGSCGTPKSLRKGR